MKRLATIGAVLVAGGLAPAVYLCASLYVLAHVAAHRDSIAIDRFTF